ncbi:MAG: hypothetical protein GC154_06700 [bacterium]|nr:hypothetical protein [bacterium]
MGRSILRFILFIPLALISCFHAQAEREIGWSLSLASGSDWEQLSKTGTLEHDGDNGVIFTLPPNSRAAWKLNTQPIWLDMFQDIQVRFRCEGVRGDLNFPVITFYGQPFGSVHRKTQRLTLNPPAKPIQSGENKLVQHTGGKNDDGVKWDDAADCLTFELWSGPEALRFELRELTVDIDEAAPLFKTFPFNAAQGEDDSEIEFLHPSAATIPLGDICGVTAPSTRLRGPWSSDSPLFELSDDGVCATPLAATGEIVIDANSQGSEAYLLMGVWLAGSNGSFTHSYRNELSQPEEIIIRKEYEDGSVEKSFPWSIRRYAYSMESGQWDVFAVPLDPDKTLRRLVVEDRVVYGRLFVAAASLNRGALRSSDFKQPFMGRREYNARIDGVTPSISTSGRDEFTLSDSTFDLTLSTRDGLTASSLVHKLSGDQLLNAPALLFSVIANGSMLGARDWRIRECEVNEGRLHVSLDSRGGEMLAARLSLSAATPDAVEMTLTLTNQGAAPVNVRVMAPALQSLRCGTAWVYPTERMAWGEGSIEIAEPYSGRAPLQFLDVYSSGKGYGVALHARDPLGTSKRLRLKVDDSGARLGVEYGYEEPLLLKPGESFETPPSLIEIHDGDWFAAFKRYREWLNSLDGEREPNASLKDVFIARRDYPVTGTGYLYNPFAKQYDFERLIETTRAEFGGLDWIELAGWGYPPESPDKIAYGGSESLAGNIQEANENGVGVGLYFDPHIPMRRYGDAIFDSPPHGEDGISTTEIERKSLTWAPWRSFVIDTTLALCGALKPNGAYFDYLGMYTPGENAAETSFLNELRAQADEDHGAFYAERAPGDIAALSLDGALSYALLGGSSPTPLPVNLLRFALPRLKIMERVHPGWTTFLVHESAVKLSLFHGEAIHLKGRAHSWYSDSFRRSAAHAYAVFHRHEDAFTSLDVEPLIPTQQGGVYANRFSSDTETVVTLYNASMQTIAGDLATIETGYGAAGEEWGMVDFNAARHDNAWTIRGRLHPHDIACVVFHD